MVALVGDLAWEIFKALPHTSRPGTVTEMEIEFVTVATPAAATAAAPTDDNVEGCR